MLQLVVPMEPEMWDEVNEVFIPPKTVTLQLEHSLVSLSKWESKWCKPFLSNKGLTDEESLDYIKCMAISKNVNPEVFDHFTKENVKAVIDYINAPMTATTFSKESNGKTNKEIVTSELIYYWMIAYNIPSEYQKWHLNRLLTLIRVCGIKNAPPKKMGKGEIMRNNAALNAARRAKLHSKG